MIRLVIAIGFAFGTFIAAATMTAAQPVDRRHETAALIERGRTLVRDHCSRCHAIGGSGESTFRGAPIFRELWRRYPVDVLEEALAEGFTSGHPAMPEFVFSPRDAEAIVTYLLSIQRPRGRR